MKGKVLEQYAELSTNPFSFCESDLLDQNIRSLIANLNPALTN